MDSAEIMRIINHCAKRIELCEAILKSVGTIKTSSVYSSSRSLDEDAIKLVREILDSVADRLNCIDE